MNQEQKYETAFAQLQDIVRKMENDESTKSLCNSRKHSDSSSSARTN